MKNSTLPTALERLIQPLPNDLKAAMLEAWKNEDIPHDENDSVYRLMVLLTLYARFYQDMAMMIVAASDKINQAHKTHLTEIRETYAKQAEQNRELAEDLKVIYQSVMDLRKVMDEKPKQLRSQMESEVKSVFSDIRKEGREIISEFSAYTARFKNDCEEWRARAYFAFLIGGIFIGIGGTLLVLGLINSHGS
jgi:Mg2+ and Co2+ transporter CorA